MQSIQNIPSPDVSSAKANEEFNSHPGSRRNPSDIEDQPNNIEGEPIPIPPGEPIPFPIEEPAERDDVPIEEDDDNEPKKIVGDRR